MMSLALANAINYIQRPVYLSLSEEPVDSGYVYILTNDRLNVLYAPVTSDLKRRIYHHKRRLIAGFTRRYNVDRLVYFERLPDMAEARSREKKLKGICRARKDAMIYEKNPEWRDLYDEFIHPSK